MEKSQTERSQEQKEFLANSYKVIYEKARSATEQQWADARESELKSDYEWRALRRKKNATTIGLCVVLFFVTASIFSGDVVIVPLCFIIEGAIIRFIVHLVWGIEMNDIEARHEREYINKNVLSNVSEHELLNLIRKYSDEYREELTIQEIDKALGLARILDATPHVTMCYCISDTSPNDYY